MDEFLWLWTAIKDYQSLIIAPLTFVGGYLIHKRVVQQENLRFHFKELRDHAIHPVTSMVEEEFAIIEPLEQAKKASTKGFDFRIPENQKKYQLDGFLLDDFLANHYPEFIPLWNELYECQKWALDKMREINNTIDHNLRSALQANNFELTPNSTRHTFSYELFKNAVRNLALQDKNPKSGFQEDRLQPGRILFEGTIIYMLNDNEDIESTLIKLRSVLDSVIMNKEIKASISEYGLLFQKKNRLRVIFKQKLNPLVHKNSLKIRRRLLRPRCDLIK